MRIALIFALLSLSAFAQDYGLEKGSAEYTVKHLVKTVKGNSEALKGKISCAEKCEFLLAAPVKSFVSSDSNRDLNMQTTLEALKFPLVTAKGSFPVEYMKQESFEIKALVSLHGVEKEYNMKIKKNGEHMKGSFISLMESHKVERPSLLTFAIDNEVPIEFNLDWKLIK